MPSQTTDFMNLLEAVPDALVGVDRSGVICLANHQAESLFGYDRKALVGLPLENLMPESRRRAHRKHREGFAAAPRARTMGRDLDLIGLRRDGSEFPVDISLTQTTTLDDSVVIAAVRDMTRYRMAEADRERLSRMASMVEFSSEAIVGITLDGTVTSWNPAAEEMFGFSSDEVIGQPGRLLAPEDRADETGDALTLISQGERVERFETIRARKDGSLFPVSVTWSPILDTERTLVGAASMLHDLTEQKQTFESARSMIEASLDSLVATNPQGKITDANEATVRITGVRRDELIGTGFSQYFTDPGQADEIYQRVFTEGTAVDYPLTMRHLNGDLTSVLCNASVYRDSNGNVLGMFAAARDMSEQMKAARYSRSLIEAALDPMVTISPEGDITDVNEATVRVTGVSRRELIGTSFSDYFTDPERANRGYQRVFEQGAVTDYPLTLRRRSGGGAPTEVLYNASLYRDTGGNVLGVFASARDVTKQVQTQKKLAEQQARELDRLAELERFQRLTVGRELKMIELKKQIEYLSKHGPSRGGKR